MSNQNIDKIPEFSIVILCYQTGEYVITFVKEIIECVTKLNINYELVLVANFWKDTNDDTPSISHDLASNDPHIKVVALPKEGLMGWDMISGLKAASGKIIAVIDGDGQMLPYDLVRVYKKLKEENLDLVMTFRTKRGDKLFRIFISLVYNFIFRILFPGLPIHDVNSKPKVFTREVYQKLNLASFDWFIDAEIIIQARRLHLKIGEVPTFFKKINMRKSYVTIGAISEFIKNLVKARIHEFGAKRR